MGCCAVCCGKLPEEEEEEKREEAVEDHITPPVKVSNLYSTANINDVPVFNKPSNVDLKHVKTNLEALDLTERAASASSKSRHGHHHHHHRSWAFPNWHWGSHKHSASNSHKYVLGNPGLLSQVLHKQNNHKIAADCFLFTNVLALNALDLTAPASDALLKNRKNAWVQLAGHPGSFAPAGPHTIWKKRMTKENNETVAYQALSRDAVQDIVPKFYREVYFNGDVFIEIEDLLQHFTNPSIMDIKMGTRTFLESEVTNPVVRKDLYEKMVKLNMDEPTEEEHEQKAITKLRYMQFREKDSSTATLGFRIEALRMSGEPPNTDLKKIKTREQVKNNMALFLQDNLEVMNKLIHRLEAIREKFAESEFFRNHEIIGSSLLILYDHHHHANVWLIDFAKTLPVEGYTITHRATWEVGNHEDGYLIGLENIATIIKEIISEMPNCTQEESSSNKSRIKEGT